MIGGIILPEPSVQTCRYGFLYRLYPESRAVSVHQCAVLIIREFLKRFIETVRHGYGRVPNAEIEYVILSYLLCPAPSEIEEIPDGRLFAQHV